MAGVWSAPVRAQNADIAVIANPQVPIDNLSLTELRRMLLGDRGRALDALEKAHGEHDFAITQITVAPWAQPLRTEPRFVDLVNRLGLGK